MTWVIIDILIALFSYNLSVGGIFETLKYHNCLKTFFYCFWTFCSLAPPVTDISKIWKKSHISTCNWRVDQVSLKSKVIGGRKSRANFNANFLAKISKKIFKNFQKFFSLEPFFLLIDVTYTTKFSANSKIFVWNWPIWIDFFISKFVDLYLAHFVI